MSITYEQFLALLRNSTTRRLLGIEISDEEAGVLAADSMAACAYYEAWSTAQGISSAAEPNMVVQTTPAAPVERVLLDISTVGRGGEPAKARITTERLFLSTTAGVSTWKALLGATTLGLSTVVTGINAGIGGDLDIPVSAVSAAVITKTGMAYSTIKLLVGGDALEIGLASVSCRAVTDTINAAVSGGHRASAAADAWIVYQQGHARQWPNERHLRKMLKRGQISQPQFEHDAAISRALQSLVLI